MNLSHCEVRSRIGKAGNAVKKWMVTNALAHVTELVGFTDVATNSYVTTAVGKPMF